MKNNFLKIILSVFILSLFTSISTYANPAPSGLAIEMSPVAQHFVLRKNEGFDNTFKLSNSSDKDMKFSVYTAPMSVSGEDYEISFSHENNRSQIYRWITFKQDDGKYVDRATFTVKAKQSRDITYKISVPADIPGGGQYAFIFSEVDKSNVSQDKDGVRPIPRLSMAVYGRTEGDTRQEAEISELSLPGFLIGSEINASSLIKNTGNTDLESESTLSVYDIFGNSVAKLSRNQKIFPDQPFRSKISTNGIKPVFGVYRAVYNIRAHDKITSRTVIIISMNLIFAVLSIILLTILTIFVIIKIKQRKERRASELI